MVHLESLSLERHASRVGRGGLSAKTVFQVAPLGNQADFGLFFSGFGLALTQLLVTFSGFYPETNLKNLGTVPGMDSAPS